MWISRYQQLELRYNIAVAGPSLEVPHTVHPGAKACTAAGTRVANLMISGFLTDWENGYLEVTIRAEKSYQPTALVSELPCIVGSGGMTLRTGKDPEESGC
jgi:hypothetical protein